MGIIKVQVSWSDNYGACSDQVLGCVATHKTLDGVKNAYAASLGWHLNACVPTVTKFLKYCRMIMNLYLN